MANQQVHLWLSNIMKLFENINGVLLLKIQQQCIDIKTFEERFLKKILEALILTADRNNHVRDTVFSH